MDCFLEEDKIEDELYGQEFEGFIRKVETSNHQRKMDRYHEVLMKKKKKENWLIRSRIFPPSFDFKSSTITKCTTTHNLKPHSLYKENSKDNLMNYETTFHR